MLEICFGTYLVLGLPVMLLLWMALAVSKLPKANDQQRHYQITLAVARLNDMQEKYHLLEDPASA